MFKIARGLLLAGLAVASTSACASFYAEALQPSDFADTEASTNVFLDVTQVLSVGDHLPRSFVATEGRVTLATGAATGAMFSPQWNMARIVARGGVESNERISVKMSRNAMSVIIK